ncbi:MAG: hypothetical protein JRI68_22565 [Deltaproteobacteria bacterium]|nr:hypothetical protein [Deltaproteobacteria bacterium]
MTEEKIGRDVFLALAAVGWADGKLDLGEADAIVRMALEEGLELEEIEEIEKATKKPLDIGEIDISEMSKADRLFVYSVGSWITRVDGHVADEEIAALDKLGEALKIPERPRQHADKIVAEIGKLGESEEAAFFNLPKLRRTLKVRLAEAQKLRAEQAPDDEDEDDKD